MATRHFLQRSRAHFVNSKLDKHIRNYVILENKHGAARVSSVNMENSRYVEVHVRGATFMKVTNTQHKIML